MQFISIEEAVRRDGLRLVIVAGTPSPWGQAAKAMIEYKGLTYAAAPQVMGGANEALVAWAGVNSGPVVAWNDERPLSRWDDILFLLERIAPQRSLLPADIVERVQLFGLAQEICGECGLGWNRRLSLFQPAMRSGNPPEAVLNMARKYRYNESDVAAAEARQVATLDLLTAVLSQQRARGRRYFIGAGPTALDFYWAAFCNLFDILPPEHMAVDAGFRGMLETLSPTVRAALSPQLLEHRDHMMQHYFKLPMEL